MSEPEIDRDDPDNESMFDFLAEEDSGVGKRRNSPRKEGKSSLPIIRKPVPISHSGPLLPPKPGSPVEPPPPLTDATANELSDDFDFLDDVAGPAMGSRPLADEAESRRAPAGNVTRFPTRDVRGTAVTQPRRAIRQTDVPDSPARVSESHQTPATQSRPTVRRDFRDFDDFDLESADDDQFAPDWHDGIHADTLAANDRNTGSRFRWFVVAVAMIAAGLGSLLYTNPPLWLSERLLPFVQNSAEDVPNNIPVELAGETGSVPRNTDSNQVQAEVDLPQPISVSPLMKEFTEQLARIEGLVNSGLLDEAEQALATMDRTVYGYGAYEFSELETLIAQIRSGTETPIERPSVAPEQQLDQEAQVVSQQQAALEAQAAQEEQAALEAQAAREEQAALEAQAAQEEQAALEAQAALEEQAALEAQAAREEQAALEAQAALEEQAALEAQAALEEQAALEAQAALEEARRAGEAARAEAIRAQEAALAAQELAAKQEQERLAELAQQAAAVAQARRDQQAVDADRLATDRRIAEERAAAERQRAREQRLIQAREREAARLAQQQNQTDQVPVPVTAGNEWTAVNQQSNTEVVVEPVVEAPSVITDEDLQLVYRQFSELQNAIRSRDINAVVALTQRSGVRIQQFMQMFENSAEIDSRIQNVSTRNATGEIRGTLRINRIRRNDGIVTEPPASLSTIPLISRREGSGWSAILW